MFLLAFWQCIVWELVVVLDVAGHISEVLDILANIFCNVLYVCNTFL